MPMFGNLQDLKGSWKWSALALGCAAMLAACGGGSSDVDDDDHGHDHVHIDTAGRLVVLQAESAQVHVFDLDGKRVMQSHTADEAPSAVYASPDRRYAVLMQRTGGRVQFVDGGIWQEDHGDHLHDYMSAPSLLNLRLSGVRPTHYEAHDGQAAIFFDGNADAGAAASVTVLSDASIGNGQALAQLPLAVPMHGTAEPRGDYLLTTWRAADADTTLPSQVELYRRDGQGYTFVQRFEETCPGLHGSYSNARYSAFGCSDGVLIVAQNGNQFSARKIANPDGLGTARIGTITGHEDWGKFVGIASPGHFFEIDPAAASIRRIDWAEDRTRRAFSMDGEGKNLLVLDDLGTLHILDVATWAKRAEIQDAIAQMPTAAPWPAFAVSRADDKAWLSDPQGQRLLEIDLGDAKIDGALPLNFSPTGMTWLGIGEHTH